MKMSLNLFNLVPLIIHGVQVAEKMKGATGPEKKEIAIDLIKTGLKGTETATGKDILDDDEAMDAVSEGIDAVIHAVNTIKKVQGLRK